jgi:hypothetical protein
MLIFLASLLATLASILRSRAALELENRALRHQIGVLQRSARKRPAVSTDIRHFLARVAVTGVSGSL